MNMSIRFKSSYFRKTGLVFALLLAGLMSLAVSASATPALPSTNTIVVTLDPINGNTAAPNAAVKDVSGELLTTVTAAGAQWYATSVTAGMMYGFEVVGNSLESFDWFLSRVDANGNPSTDGDENFPDTRDWFRCTQTGTIYLAVYSFPYSYTDANGNTVFDYGPLSKGSYTVRVLQTAPVLISGRVIGSNGNGIANKNITGFPNTNTSWGDGAWLNDGVVFTNSTVTSSAGEFGFYVAAGWSGTVRANAIPTPTSGTYSTLYKEFNNLRADTTCNFDFSNVAMLGGKVTTASSKKGVAGSPVSHIRMVASNSFGSTWTLTDATGSWSIPVPTGWQGSVYPNMSSTTGTLTYTIQATEWPYAFNFGPLPYSWTYPSATWPSVGYYYQVTSDDWTAGSSRTGKLNFTATPQAVTPLEGTGILLMGYARQESRDADGNIYYAAKSGIKVYAGGSRDYRDYQNGTSNGSGIYSVVVALPRDGSGWDGVVYADPTAFAFGTSYTLFQSNNLPYLALSSVQSFMVLPDLIVRNYKTLDNYYDIVVNKGTPLTSAVDLSKSRITTNSIQLVLPSGSANTVKITRKKPARGAVIDYPPIGNVILTTSSLPTTDSLPLITCDGKVATFYTEGSILGDGLFAGSGLGDVTAKGCAITHIFTTGTLSSVNITNDYGVMDVDIVALGEPVTTGRSAKKGKIQIAGMELQGVYAPNHSFSGITVTGKKFSVKGSAATYWLDGGIYGDIIVTAADAIAATEGGISIGNLIGAIPSIGNTVAASDLNRNMELIIGYMDNQATKVKIISVGGNVILDWDARVKGSVDTISAKPVTFRIPDKLDGNLYGRGGEVYIWRLAAGYGVTDAAKAKGEGDIKTISGPQGVFAGALVAGATVADVWDYYMNPASFVKPRYFGAVGTIATDRKATTAKPILWVVNGTSFDYKGKITGSLYESKTKKTTYKYNPKPASSTLDPKIFEEKK